MEVYTATVLTVVWFVVLGLLVLMLIFLFLIRPMKLNLAHKLQTKITVGSLEMKLLIVCADEYKGDKT
jgi:hypothetical protein